MDDSILNTNSPAKSPGKSWAGSPSPGRSPGKSWLGKSPGKKVSDPLGNYQISGFFKKKVYINIYIFNIKTYEYREITEEMQDLLEKNLKNKLVEREMDQGPPPNPYENIEQEIFETNKDLKTSFYLERLRFGNKLLILMTIFATLNAIIYVSLYCDYYILV